MKELLSKASSIAKLRKDLIDLDKEFDNIKTNSAYNKHKAKQYCILIEMKNLCNDIIRLADYELE